MLERGDLRRDARPREDPNQAQQGRDDELGLHSIRTLESADKVAVHGDRGASLD